MYKERLIDTKIDGTAVTNVPREIPSAPVTIFRNTIATTETDIFCHAVYFHNVEK